MAFGFRKPSFRKRIAARTSWKRYVRHSLGFKAPRGWGWITNPRRALYNRAYNRTTCGLGRGCMVMVVAMLVPTLAVTILVTDGCSKQAHETVGPVAEERSAQAHDRDYWHHKAQEHGISPSRQFVCKQLARLPKGLGYITYWPDIDETNSNANDPLRLIYGVGMDALPTLVEALDDHTLTTVFTCDTQKGTERTWRINELASFLIRRITERYFMVQVPGKSDISDLPTVEDIDLMGVGDHPELIPQFKTIVLDWYAKSGKKPLVESKIEDLEGGWRNFSLAAKWLGEHKAREAVPALIRAVDRNVNEHDEDAASEAAFALGQIGDKDGLPAVRRACKFWLDGAVKRIQMDSEYDSQYLFSCFHGLAMLGEKDEALKDLRLLYDQERHRLSASGRQTFESLLERAKMEW
jgi:hypothetical protein